MEILNIKKNIILGSKSPRRKELLKLMGFRFKTQALNVEESYPKSLSPIKIALFLSKKKANSYNISSKDLLICADTLVYKQNNIFEKPKSNQDAVRMLKLLSNQRHFVVTGVTIKTKEKTLSFYDRSIVYFKKLTKKEISFYVNYHHPLDKAGGYGIQDWIGLIGIRKITGSFYNVMGLPTHKLYKKIQEISV